ncbi:MoaA/NifB/PqqE/SkfB family radical SAM enzyme [Pedobacter sp. AK017]|uniref:radical SAM protein n=1 Tax=Pedobacter sp. AK017 TaxID=2723073 RepID=UPI0016137B08|nr:radical SAM protein [Pedobacter sp. AK017]MBB5441238.1 MoaA/NifB/PqqE/SkfB family radical SAM enzyme [Pedobacter sp. AK017]
MKIATKLSAPNWIVFQLVEKCNLRCKMCYQWGDTGSYHEKEALTTLQFKSLEKIINDCADSKPTFGLFGGEPLLHPQVFELIKLITDKGCYVYAATNGTLIEQYAEELIDSKINRLWISVDGPQKINDLQRGNGVFKRVMKGISKLTQLKKATGSHYPELGITYIVTPTNAAHIEDFFFNHINLDEFAGVSIEMQNYTTVDEHLDYVEVLSSEFGVKTMAPIASGLIQDPVIFKNMDMENITQQIFKVKELCDAKKIILNTSPKTVNTQNYKNYFSANWEQLEDKKSHCVFPFIQAEITATGDVVGCHTFYDLPMGNIYQTDFLDIWNGERWQQLRKYIRKDLFPICTSCCSYYYNPSSKY